MTTKKILLYLTPEKYPSFYDIVLGYDSGADIVFPYTSLKVGEVKGIIYDVVFTRKPESLKELGLFVGGDNFETSQNLLEEIQKNLEKFPQKMRPSLIFDPAGACTTSASCIAKIKASLGNLTGKKGVILAGTGPVGQCSSILLAQEKAHVSITSRQLEKAEKVTEKLKKRWNIEVMPSQGSNLQEIEEAIQGVNIIISTGPEGIIMLPKKIWSQKPEIKVLADVNSVVPLGIEGLEPDDDGRERQGGKICFGASGGIGKLKVKVHKKLLEKVFQETGQVYDLEKIYQLTLEFLR